MGERTRTLTGILTPQYAPIEQYALDGKQGPWSDIYSAAAVLHHAVLREEGGGFVAVGDDGEKVEQKCLGVGHGALSSNSVGGGLHADDGR